jgi:hypothetical protein
VPTRRPAHADQPVRSQRKTPASTASRNVGAKYRRKPLTQDASSQRTCDGVRRNAARRRERCESGQAYPHSDMHVGAVRSGRRPQISGRRHGRLHRTPAQDACTETRGMLAFGHAPGHESLDHAAKPHAGDCNELGIV